MNFTSKPVEALSGNMAVPGDKSISHRSLMLGALATGKTRVMGFLNGEDNVATLHIMRALGVNIETHSDTELLIHGVGMRGLTSPHQPLDCGNAGTAIRLLTGLLAGQEFDSVLTGDQYLLKRPMRRVTDPLKTMGAVIETTGSGCAPLHIKGQQALHGVTYEMPIASAQVKSCLLLAGMYAQGTTTVIEPGVTRDHTERMLRAMGYPVVTKDSQVLIEGGHTLTGCEIQVPGDISSAAFFMVAASITPDSSITLKNIGINPTRDGVIRILRLMGASIEITNQRQCGDEPVADITVCSAPLQGIEIPQDLVPLAIDEFPVLMIAAANARGTTVLTGARELRVKETDRIQAMADGLSALGVAVDTFEDGMSVTGGPLNGGTVDSCGDHRIAMAFAVAGLTASASIRILDVDNVATSFPGFVALANGVGFRIDT